MKILFVLNGRMQRLTSPFKMHVLLSSLLAAGSWEPQLYVT